MEQLIQLTNSEEFISEWALFVTDINLVPRTDRMIVSLEAYYDSFEEDLLVDRKSWKIACNGFFGHRLYPGYLGMFRRMKVMPNHPLLWNYGSETYFSVQGPCKDIALLMGELFLVHNEISGNWVQFHRIFGFLPKLLNLQSKNQLAAPTPLIEHYLLVFQRHEIRYTLNTSQENRNELSVLLFTSAGFPDNYDYGQSYIAASWFEILESI